VTRAACVVLSFFLIGLAEAQDNVVRVAPGKRIEILVPGAMMAFSRHSANARMLGEDGSVFLAARQPGTTQIVVLTSTQVLRFRVVVTDASSLRQSHGKPASDPKHANRKEPEEVVTSPARLEQQTVSVEDDKVPLKEVPVQAVIGSGAAIAEVQEGHRLQIKIPGATGALSVDSELLDASGGGGFVNLTGRAPGRAEVLIVTPEGLKNIFVLVRRAPPSYPPGFVAPQSPNSEESGSYEFRFASDRWQIQNRFDFTANKSGHSTQIHFVNVNFLDGLTDHGRASLPSGFYRFATPCWNLTVMDEFITNSPLTINGAIVRGLHLGLGPWTVHAGYSSLATFSDFLIPTQREAAFAISHAFKLSPNSELVQNAYYFPTSPHTFTAGRPGGVGSLEYSFHQPHGLQLLGEIGFSHGIGAAADLQWADTNDHLHASFRQKPANFASLSVGNLPGSVSEFAWNREIKPSLTANTNFSDSHLILPTGTQTNLTSVANLQYKFLPHWSLATGTGYSAFSQSFGNASSSIHSLSLPEQINFDSNHFGAGFQYQFTSTSGSLSPGHDLRGTARVSRGGLQLTGFVDRQTQALSVDSLYSQIPSLRLELQKLGVGVIGPAQLMALLQDNAFLLALGFSQQTTLNLVPSRLQFGASLNWTSQGTRPARLSLDFIRSRDRLLQGSVSNWIQSGSYTKSLTPTNELFLSYSWFRYSALGQAQHSPLVEIGLRHNFSSLPGFVDFGSHGTLTGVVFVDDEMRGVYDPQMRVLPGAELVLDGWQRTRTDNHGRYVFARVPQGAHTVEAKFQSAMPHWFTTPSVVTLPINSSADFGITFARSELVGHLRNDAGLGVRGAEIEVIGPDVNLRAHCDADGRFGIPGLVPGEYQLRIDPNTVPDGYILEELNPLQVRLEKGVPQNVEFRIRAIRTLSGEVSYYDPKSGRYAPLVGALVKIPKLSLQITTNRMGRFVFLDLPTGNYALTIFDKKLALTRVVSIPTEPIELQETFRIPRR
jgi:hypothetical protein